MEVSRVSRIQEKAVQEDSHHTGEQKDRWVGEEKGRPPKEQRVERKPGFYRKIVEWLEKLDA